MKKLITICLMFIFAFVFVGCKEKTWQEKADKKTTSKKEIVLKEEPNFVELVYWENKPYRSKLEKAIQALCRDDAHAMEEHILLAEKSAKEQGLAITGPKKQIYKFAFEFYYQRALQSAERGDKFDTTSYWISYCLRYAPMAGINIDKESQKIDGAIKLIERLEVIDPNYDFAKDESLPIGLKERIKFELNALSIGDSNLYIQCFDFQGAYNAFHGKISISESYPGWLLDTYYEDIPEALASSMIEPTNIMNLNFGEFCKFVSDDLVFFGESPCNYKIVSAFLAPNGKYAHVYLKSEELGDVRIWHEGWVYYGNQWWQFFD